jgi:hypothetical protein
VAFLDASGQVVATRFGGTLAGLGGGGVTRAGDFLGTGRALVALGAPGARGGAGEVLLLDAETLAPVGAVSLFGPRLGTTLDALDADGDGRLDLLASTVDAPGEPLAGRTLVLYSAQQGAPGP